MPARHPSTPLSHLHRTSASAPGKIILLGEHAVVHGYPAIAVPFQAQRATAVITDLPPGAGARLSAPDLAQEAALAAWPKDDALALAMRLSLSKMNITREPDWHAEVSSDIPVASGLGSGAAVATALIRALCLHGGHRVSADTISEMVFRCEEIHHGTPSGIDNTVIAHEQPVWFVKGGPPLLFAPRRPLTFVVADSGISSPTRETVADVARLLREDPTTITTVMDEIGSLVGEARHAVEEGDGASLGPLLDRNQALLTRLTVSSPILERLVAAARRSGALGAKLSGGGRGGNVIALVHPERAQTVAAALLSNGARSALINRIAG